MWSNPYFCAALLLTGVLISAVSQVFLKKAAMKKYKSPILEYLNPMVMGAYLMFFGTTFLSVLAYRGIPLSLGPVLESTSYIYVMFFGAVIFKEKITLKKIIALVCIVAGILVYSFFG